MIFLTILKWIGIVLLGLLGLVLLILLLLLFFPFTYSLAVDDKDVVFKLSYLFGLLNAKAEYVASEFKYRVRITWYTLMPKKEEKEENVNSKRDKTSNKDELAKTDSIGKNEESIENTEENSIEKTTEDEFAKIQKKDKIDENTVKAEDIKKRDKITDHTETTNETDKAKKSRRSLKEIINGFFDKLIKKKDAIVDKFLSLADSYNKYTDDCAKETYTLVLKELSVLLKHIRARRGKMDFSLGFEDPSTTGYVLAIYSMVYPKVGKRFRLHPNFEEAMYEGKGKIYGHLQLYVIVLIGVRLYFNKTIKEFLNRR